MRYLSLFSGLEGASLAWKPLGWTCVAVAETDPACCAVLDCRWPGIPNLGDVRKITEGQVKDLGHIDLVVFGSPCFPAGTLVLTSVGYRPIEAIRAGDLVLTHEGRWRRVLRI